MKFYVYIFLIAAMALSAKDSVAGSCKGDSAAARFLPRVIGRPHSSIRTPYPMPCDTMEVKIGDTCTIHPGVMMHFGPASRPENVILVRGMLEVLGSEEAPVVFSGSLMDGDFGPKPGTGAWGGFRVDAVGEVVIKNARIFKAIPALESKSEHVKFQKVVLKQCLDLNGPNGQSLALDFKETRIDELNFSSSNAPLVTKTQEESPQPEPKVTSRSKAALAWTLIGTGAVLAGGGLFWYLNESKNGSPSKPGEETTYPARPGFPIGLGR